MLAERGPTEIVIGGEPRRVPLTGGDEDRAVDLSVHVGAVSHPYLSSHAIKGVPVVPVVLALEWFARAARAVRPDLQVGSVQDLRVLRGVRLGGFDGVGDRLRVRAHELSNGDGSVVAAELIGRDGAAHYRATVHMVAVLPSPAAPPAAPAMSQYADAVYGGEVLFHGPAFQVISELEGVGREGTVALLRGTADVDWPAEPWHTDPAALDGGLQLALLWAAKALGGPSLPTGIAFYRAYANGPAIGPIRCVLRGQGAGARATCDIILVDGAGNVFAELRGVDTHQLPPAAAASARA